MNDKHRQWPDQVAEALDAKAALLSESIDAKGEITKFRFWYRTERYIVMVRCDTGALEDVEVSLSPASRLSGEPASYFLEAPTIEKLLVDDKESRIFDAGDASDSIEIQFHRNRRFFREFVAKNPVAVARCFEFPPPKWLYEWEELNS